MNEINLSPLINSFRIESQQQFPLSGMGTKLDNGLKCKMMSAFLYHYWMSMGLKAIKVPEIRLSPKEEQGRYVPTCCIARHSMITYCAPVILFNLQNHPQEAVIIIALNEKKGDEALWLNNLLEAILLLKQHPNFNLSHFKNPCFPLYHNTYRAWTHLKKELGKIRKPFEWIPQWWKGWLEHKKCTSIIHQ